MEIILIILVVALIFAGLFKLTSGILKVVFGVLLCIVTFPWGPIIYLLWKILKK